MSWPKGRPRPRKVSISQGDVATIEGVVASNGEPIVLGEVPHEPNQPPPDWRKGMLLNVRNHGAEYIITLYPEEYDARHEDRCLKFTNLGECQNFVSDWYSRQSHDPRAR